MKRIFFVLCALLFGTGLLVASPDLAKYLENDLELQRLALEVKKAELSSSRSRIVRYLGLGSVGTSGILVPGPAEADSHSAASSQMA